MNKLMIIVLLILCGLKLDGAASSDAPGRAGLRPKKLSSYVEASEGSTESFSSDGEEDDSSSESYYVERPAKSRAVDKNGGAAVAPQPQALRRLPSVEVLNPTNDLDDDFDSESLPADFAIFLPGESMRNLFMQVNTGNVRDVRQALDAIYEAMERDEASFVQSLVSCRVEKSSLLHYAVSNVTADGVAIVKEIMQRLANYPAQRKQLLSACDEHGYNVLFCALSHESDEMMDVVLDLVVNDPAIPAPERFSLLYATVKKADEDPRVFSLFHIAARQGLPGRIKQAMKFFMHKVAAPALIKRIFEPMESGVTVLHCAVESKEPQMVDFLLKYLYAAVALGFISEEQRREIIDHKTIRSQSTALHYAAVQKDRTMGRLLCEAGAQILRNHQGIYPVIV